jgi:hypothetical protein
MPTSTDLVTDLPADFEVFGQAVDTRLKALQPGTTLGDLAYSSATANTNTRLGIGTTNQVLSVVGGVPAWATPTAGGMTSIASGSFTAVASVTISSIPATYKNLQLVIRDMDMANDNRALRIRPNGTVTGYVGVSLANFQSTAATGLIPTDAIQSFYNYSTTNDQNVLVLNIFDYANSTTYKVWQINSVFMATGSDSVSDIVAGSFKDVTAISSIVFSASSGNFAGDYTLYGVS